jgi:hypothetical protein
MQAAELAERDAFRERLRADASTLARNRTTLQSLANSPALPEELQTFAHKLAGAAAALNSNR